MTPTAAPPPDPANMRCPTCRAPQAWSDTCRRCRSDLRLLRDFARGYDQARRDCLENLHAGRPEPASAAAARCHALVPGVESRRLLAITALHRRDWAAALAHGLARDPS